MTRPAVTRTRFLMMYCPSSVGAIGTTVKHFSGKRNRGVTVPSIWSHKRKSVARRR